MTDTLLDADGDPIAERSTGRARYVDDLTPRERQVLIELARGHTTLAAAQRLGVSANTVHTHVKHIYEKLGIRSRSQAALAAVRLRLVKP